MTLAIEISKRLFLLNSASAVITRVLRLTVVVWLYQHLLKRVSAEEFEIYVLVITVMVFAPLFSTLFLSGIGRYVVEACAKDDERRVRQIISSIVPLLTGWGLVLLGVGVGFAWNIDLFLKVKPEHLPEAQLMLCLLLFDFTVNMVLSPFTVGFQVRQKFVLHNAIQLGGEIARIALLFLLIYGVSTRALWVVVSSVVANVATQWVCVVVSRRLLPALRFQRNLSDFRIARDLLSFGFWTAVGHLAYLLYINVDIFILNRLSTPLDVANFKLGSEFYIQIQGLINITLGVFLPALTAMHAKGEWGPLGNAYLRGSRYVLWITMLIACPLIVYAHELIELYVGPKYLGAAPVMMLLLLLLPLAQSIGFLPPLASATAKLRQFCLTSLVSQLVKMVFTLYLVGVLHQGATGCALSTTIIIGLAVMIGFWPLGLKLAHVSFGRFAHEVLWRGLVPMVLALGAGFFLRSLGWPLGWLSLAAQAGLCCLVYAVALFALCLNPEERAWGLRLLKVR